MTDAGQRSSEAVAAVGRPDSRSARIAGTAAAAVATAIALSPVLPWWSSAATFPALVIAVVGPGFLLGWCGRRWWPPLAAVATFAMPIVDERANSLGPDPVLRPYLEVFVLYAVVAAALAAAGTVAGLVTRRATPKLRGTRGGPANQREAAHRIACAAWQSCSLGVCRPASRPAAVRGRDRRQRQPRNPPARPAPDGALAAIVGPQLTPHRRTDIVPPPRPGVESPPSRSRSAEKSTRGR